MSIFNEIEKKLSTSGKRTAGVGSAPDTVDTAKALQKLFKKPIKASDIRVIYNLVWEEDLYVRVIALKKVFGEHYDIRGTIAETLNDWINVDKLESIKSWDPEALKICQSLIKEFI